MGSLGAKLCDFGLTMPMQPDQTHITRRAGGESGSPRYMAPEFFLQNAKLTEKIDVWALGCVLIETFGGELPYEGCASLAQICTQICVYHRGPAVSSAIPAEIAEVILR